MRRPGRAPRRNKRTLPLPRTTGRVELHGDGDLTSAPAWRTARAAAPRPDRVGDGDGMNGAGSGFTGRRFANSPSPLRVPSSPCSGRGFDGSVVSHFGPLTAASNTRRRAGRPRASRRQARFRTDRSTLANRGCSYSHWPGATASSTSTAGARFSGPMPSPGSRMALCATGRGPYLVGPRPVACWPGAPGRGRLGYGTT